MSYTITNAGRQIASCVGVAGWGNPEALGVLSVMVRHARTLDRLAVKGCNGPAWADRDVPNYSQRMERWERALEEKQDRLERRLGELLGELQGMGELEGVWLETGGDPRGYVVRLVWPEGEGANHFDNATACSFSPSPHCTGGAGGGSRAVGLA